MRQCIALVVALTLCSFGCKKRASLQDTPQPERIVAPQASVLPGAPALAARYEVSGIAKAARTSSLFPKGSGVLRTLRAREGDRVRAGQVLCVLDTTDSLIRRDAARVAQAQALEGIRNAQSDLDRARMLFDAGVLPDQTIEKAELAFKLAQLASQGADVNYRMASQALVDSALLAPFDGVITKLLAEEGHLVTAMPPVKVFEIADTDFLEVKVQIPERRLADVRLSMPVRVSLPAVKVERDARIDRIAEVLDSTTRSVEAVVRLDNRDHELPAGLSAIVKFPGLSADETLNEASKDMAGEKGN